MKRLFWTIFVSFAVLVAGVLGRYLLFGPVQSPDHAPVDEFIAGACKSIRNRLPIQVNPTTRIDQILPGEGRQVVYMITLDVPRQAQGNASNALEKIRPSIIAAFKRDPSFDQFRKHRIEIVHKVCNTNHEVLATLTLHPHELY